MNVFLEAVSGTPWWAWIALGYCLFVGISSLKERTVYVATLYILPMVLTFHTIYTLSFRVTLYNGINYFLVVFFGILLGHYFAGKEKKPVVDLKKGTIVIPGSWLPLVLLIAFFSINVNSI